MQVKSIRQGLIAAVAASALLGGLLAVKTSTNLLADLSISSTDHELAAPLVSSDDLAVVGVLVAAVAITRPSARPSPEAPAPSPPRVERRLALAPKTSPPRGL